MALAAVVSTPPSKTESRKAVPTKPLLHFSSGKLKYFKSHKGDRKSRKQEGREQLRPVLI